MSNIERLQYITQDHPTYSHPQLTRQACEGGVKWVQLRLKNRKEEEVRKIAEETKIICKSFNAKLILNDYVHIAHELKLDGVHIGKEDMSPVKAREILGEQILIGGTANTQEDVLALHKAKVNYIGFGPYRFTTTKEKLSRVLGLEGYQKLIAFCKSNGISIPVIAIGGIELQDVPGLLNTGIHGIAVAGVINLNPSPTLSAKKFLERIATEVVSEKL